MKIYLATGNRHKRQEMAEILSGHTIVIPVDEGIDFAPVEDGSDFYENSMIKALQYRSHSGNCRRFGNKR